MERTYVRVLKVTIHCLLVVIMMCLIQLPAFAGSAAEIDKKAELALEKLYASSPAAQELSTVAKGILIFPDVIKAGLVIGGQYGEGALLIKGGTVGYYIRDRIKNTLYIESNIATICNDVGLCFRLGHMSNGSKVFRLSIKLF